MTAAARARPPTTAIIPSLSTSNRQGTRSLRRCFWPRLEGDVIIEGRRRRGGLLLPLVRYLHGHALGADRINVEAADRHRLELLVHPHIHVPLVDVEAGHLRARRVSSCKNGDSEFLQLC